MARTSVTTQKITRVGLNVVMSGPPDVTGDIIDAGDVILVVTNGGGAPITVTPLSTHVQDDLVSTNAPVSIPAAGTREIGPFPSRTFAQADDAVVGPGRVLINYSGITSVTRAVKST